MSKLTRGLGFAAIGLVTAALLPVALPALAGAAGILAVAGVTAGAVYGAKSFGKKGPIARRLEIRRTRIAAEQAARLKNAKKLGTQQAKDKAHINTVKQEIKTRSQEAKLLLDESRKTADREARAKAQAAVQPRIDAAREQMYQARSDAQANRAEAKANAYASRLAKTFNPLAALKGDKTARMTPMLPRRGGAGIKKGLTV